MHTNASDRALGGVLVQEGHPVAFESQKLNAAEQRYSAHEKEDVQAYVKTCHVCQVDKTKRKKEAGLLQPLSIPKKPWLCVSMDFISGFPKVEGYG